MKLYIERTAATPEVDFNHETNNLKKNKNMKTGKSGKRSSSLTMAIVCAIVLCDLSFAQENTSIVSGSSNLDGADCSVFSPKDPGVLPTPFTTANFVEIGSPSGGYPTITDLVTFNGKLYLATSNNPLGDWGTNVFYTTDGTTYTKILEDNSSQGYLRMGVFDGKLWIPDGDPNGLDPGIVYTSSTGTSGSFAQGTVLAAVHTFEVIKYNNKFYCSNGMNSGNGGLCKFDGTSTWTSVYQDPNSFRMKYMAVFNGKLFVANRNTSSDVDGFVWSGDVETTSPAQLNTVSGYSSTYRWFASSLGKLFWSLSSGGQARVLVTQDGVTWQTVPALSGKFVSDFAELNGTLYALASDGLWESADHFTFQQIAPAPTSDPNAFKPVAVSGGTNPDGVASMEAYNGYLWCGSSTNGKIYQVNVGTAIPESLSASNQYSVTEKSIIFRIENNSSIRLDIYNLHGALVKSVSYGTVNSGSYEINLSELKEGVYLLEAIIGNEVKGIKFMRR
ncbi:MAG: T9SS type A sorting domain-containing protein [Bacteroidetes bacterium]|nr:MAG: T9SS type A sorting domain-containing protein [Bacteroidota bacterium]